LGPRNWTIWGTEKFIAHAGIGTLDFRAHGLVTIPTSLPWLPYYEGRYESNTSYFFSETIVTIITKFTHIVGTSCTKLRSFSHKICFTVNTIFISLRETLCADRVKPFAEGSELFTHAVLQLVFVSTTASSGVRPLGGGRLKDVLRKFKVGTSVGKVMAGIFWYSDGILLVGFLRRGVAVIQTVMC